MGRAGAAGAHVVELALADLGGADEDSAREVDLLPTASLFLRPTHQLGRAQRAQDRSGAGGEAEERSAAIGAFPGRGAIEPAAIATIAPTNLPVLKALDAARRHRARSHELRAATGLARLWRSTGRRADGHASLAEVYGWFTEGFASRDLSAARALLDELGTPPSRPTPRSRGPRPSPPS